MTKAVDAVIGVQEKCATCGVIMTCGQTRGSPEYPAKNQWQVNGKAHYNYDFKTKTTTCNGVIIEDPRNVRTPEAKAYAPKASVSPEVLRTESFIEFEKVYCEGFIKASQLVQSITIGMSDVSALEYFKLKTAITRKYIDYYIARNL